MPNPNLCARELAPTAVVSHHSPPAGKKWVIKEIQINHVTGTDTRLNMTGLNAVNIDATLAYVNADLPTDQYLNCSALHLTVGANSFAIATPALLAEVYPNHKLFAEGDLTARIYLVYEEVSIESKEIRTPTPTKIPERMSGWR